MATDLERLVVQLSADVKGYQNALNKALNQTNQRARSIENRFKKMNSAISASYGGLVTSATKAFALIGGVQGFRTLSDSATKIDNALKVSGLSGEELERTYTKLRNSAQANAAPLETLVQLYGRVSLVQGELGITSDQLVGFSNNVAMALRVSGQSSQEASGALLQLAQALGSGVVRAEEFNSIVEGAPTILQAAAAGIKEAGGSVSKLRTIMLDGGLSSKAFFDGINAGAPILGEKLANATLTIDQRMENLKTSLIDAAREFNNSSKAAEVFGTEIDRVSQFVSNINFETLIGEIQRVVAEFNYGAVAVQGFAEQVGKLSGLAGIGDSIVGALGGKNGKVEFLGGALSIQSSISGEEKLTDLAGRRLKIESQIAEVKSNPANALGQAELRQLEAQLASVNEQSSKLAGSITGGPLDYNRFPPPKSSAAVKPISLADPQYQVTDSNTKKTKGGGGSSSKTVDEYKREVEQIRSRTKALGEETEAQKLLDPLVNDFGYTLEFVRAKQDLLNAAQEAGIKITPELTKSIEGLASGYANAVVASEQLAEKQDQIRQRAEEAMATAKDVTRGLIDGFIEGASAADLLKDSLKQIADTLLNDVLDSIFKVNKAGSGGGGFLSSIFSGLFGGGKFPAAPGGSGVPMYDDGGYTGDGGKYQPAGVVHKGEYVFDKAAVAAAGGPAAMEAMRRGLKGYANGGAVGVSVPTLPSIRSVNPAAQQQAVDVRVSVDDNGNLQAYVQRESAKVTDAGLKRYDKGSLGRTANNVRQMGTRMSGR